MSPGAVLERIGAGVRAFATLVETAYRPRIVEGCLKLQIAFLALLAVGAPFGGFGLDALLGLGLVLQAGATYGVLVSLWRRRLAVARWVYLGLAALTFVEAIRNTGIAGGIFGLEAVLSLVAAWYIFALHGEAQARARAAEETEGEQDG